MFGFSAPSQDSWSVISTRCWHCLVKVTAIKGRLRGPKGLTFIGASWMGVMHEGSTMGFGLLAVSASRLCHCWGSPVNFCSRWSKPVWTRCSKLEGPEISSLFFFFPNMVERSGEVGGKQERKEKKVYTLL